MKLFRKFERYISQNFLTIFFIFIALSIFIYNNSTPLEGAEQDKNSSYVQQSASQSNTIEPSGAVQTQQNSDELIGKKISEAFKGRTSTIDASIIERYKKKARYPLQAFPLRPSDYRDFQVAVADFLNKRLKQSSDMSTQYTVSQHGKMDLGSTILELLTFDIQTTGDKVPGAICYPKKRSGSSPAVAVYSGHSRHGLLDLFTNHNGYQGALALKLCEEGYVTIAIEKIDSGFMSYAFRAKGKLEEDENRLGLIAFGGSHSLAIRQLAAALAAYDHLKSRPLVNASRLATAGTSYGGWTAILVSIMRRDVKVVIDYSMKDLFVEPSLGQTIPLTNVRDYSTVFSGMWDLGDRHIFPMAILDRKILYAYGFNDKRNKISAEKFMWPAIRAQLKELGTSNMFKYLPFPGNDEVNIKASLKFLQNNL